MRIERSVLAFGATLPLRAATALVQDFELSWYTIDGGGGAVCG